MQTFLPYPNYVKSARVLDRLRLGKQRVECLQIMKTILGHSKGWSNHPAVLMWLGHPDALLEYTAAICSEWKDRGYKDTCYNKCLLLLKVRKPRIIYPWWTGYRPFHDSHKSNLLRKNPNHYKQFGWAVASNLGYVWPNNVDHVWPADRKERV